MKVSFKRISFAALLILTSIFTAGSYLAAPVQQHLPPGSSETASLQYKVGGHVLSFSPGAAYLAGLDHALQVMFVGSNPVAPTGVGQSPTLERVTYVDLWDGIDAIYTTAQAGLVESSYLVKPGGRVETIRLSYNAPVELQADGSLRYTFQTGYISESAPIAWQEINGARVPVDVTFAKYGENEIGFVVGNFQPDQPLLIDPAYSWHAFYGGVFGEYGGGSRADDVEIDGSGNIFVSGFSTASWNGPAGQAPLHAYTSGLEFALVKLDATGAYQWHTFYDASSGFLDLDTSGNIYITGGSNVNWSGPGSVAPLHAYSGCPGFSCWDDFMILKLNSSGAYQWHTFYGSIFEESPQNITVDGNGNVYAVGASGLTWVGSGGESPLHGASSFDDITVLKLNSSGAYQWHTFYGSGSDDSAYGVVTDTGGSVYVVGDTNSAWTGPAGQSPLNSYSSGQEIFALKLNSSGAYQWHAFYGAGSYDIGTAVTIDGSSNIYITGESVNTWNGPSATPPLNPSHLNDMVVIKISGSGVYQWHTFYGGPQGDPFPSGIEMAQDIALDTAGNLFVTGRSPGSWNGPLGEFPVYPHDTGVQDIVVMKLDANGDYRWHAFYGSTDMINYEGAIAVNGDNVVIAATSPASWNGPGNVPPLNSYSGNTAYAVISMTTPGVTISGNAGIGGATLSYFDGSSKTVTSARDGSYLILAPAGWTGTVTPSHSGVSSFDPPNYSYTAISTNQVGQDFTANQPRGNKILLVDDDANNPDVRPYYTGVLNAMGRSYDIWNTADTDYEPYASELAPYSAVIWFTGNSFIGGPGPSAAGEAALAEYLNSGGEFFISSGAYFWLRGQTSFMSSHLGVASGAAYVLQTTVTGTGSMFGGLGPYTLTYPFDNFSDRISPDGTATLAFTGDQGNAGVYKANGVYRSLYLSFPLEAIPLQADRKAVICAFLGGCDFRLYLPLVIR